MVCAVSIPPTRRLYASIYGTEGDRQVMRINADGTDAREVLGGGRFSSMAFGRGILDCRDLYVANPHGPMHRLTTDVHGLPGP